MKRKYVIPILIIAAVTAGIVIYLSTRKLKDVEHQLIAKLQEWIRQGTDSLYQLNIERLEVDLTHARIGLVNASLKVDSSILLKLDSVKAAPNDIFAISVHSLSIDGLDPADVLRKKSIHLDVLTIEEPTIEVFHKKRKYNTDATKDSSSLYEKLTGQLNTIAVDAIRIKHAGFTHHNLSKKNKKLGLKDVSLEFKKILIDSTTEYDTTRFLFAEQALISLKDYSFRTTDGLYLLKADSVSIAAPANVMQVGGFSLQPALSKADFNKATQFRKEQYDVTVKHIQMNRINWWDLINQEGLRAGTVNMSDSKIKVFLDRSLPADPTSKVGNYPHQLLMKLQLPVMIDTISVTRMDVSYEEFNPRSAQSGTLYFDNTTATIANITNQQGKIDRERYLKASVHTSFMHDAPLQADFSFDLTRYKEGKFHVGMQMTKVNRTQVEKIARPLALMAIPSVHIKKLQAEVDGTNTLGKGSVLLLYDDLKIVPLKKDSDEKNGMKQKKLSGFIFNTFVLKNSNPSGNEKPRKPTGDFVREPDKSFFNLVWKTILVGILKTVGAPPSMAKSK
jgi:hypothetical protein